MIRTLAASLTLFCMTSAASADPYRIEILAPSDPSDQAAAAKYVDDLRQAIRRECSRASSPVIGYNFDRFTACVEANEVEIARKDRTGLFASALGLERPVLLAGSEANAR